MSAEMELVVIGGVIAFVSTILGTLLAFVLSYLIEERREKKRIKLELKRATTRYMALLAQSRIFRGEDPLSNLQVYYQELDKLRIEELSNTEDLAAILGLVE